VYVAGYTIFSYFGKAHLNRTVLLALVLVLVTGAFFVAARWYDARVAAAAASTDATAPTTAPVEEL
jgi:hypothetical protein